MSELQIFVDGVPVWVEAERPAGSQQTTSKIEEKVGDTFELAKRTISTMSSGLIKSVKAIEEELRPNEFYVEFGIKFKMDGTVVVVNVGGEAQLNIRMTYRDKPEKSGTSSGG